MLCMAVSSHLRGWSVFKVNTDLIRGTRTPPELKRGSARTPVHAQPRSSITINQQEDNQLFPMTPRSMTHRREEVLFLRAGVLPTTTLNGGTLSTPDGFSQSALLDCITVCWSACQGIIALALLCPKWGQGVCICVCKWERKLLTKVFYFVTVFF